MGDLKELLQKEKPEYYIDLIRTIFGNASQLRKYIYSESCLPCPFYVEEDGCRFYKLFKGNDLEDLGINVLEKSCKQFNDYKCNYNPNNHAQKLIEEENALEKQLLKIERRREARIKAKWKKEEAKKKD